MKHLGTYYVLVKYQGFEQRVLAELYDTSYKKFPGRKNSKIVKQKSWFYDMYESIGLINCEEVFTKVDSKEVEFVKILVKL